MSTTNEDTFSFWLPAQALIVKGGKGGADKEGRRWIQGIASTDTQDLQGEVISQDGIDFSYFLKRGYFNDNHKQGTEHKVGEPVECRVTKNGLWVKGFLYSGKKAADDIWEHMRTLKKSGSKRRMGFSVEGKIIRRNGNVIEKCWIKDIAITPAPINYTTWAEMAKSLSALELDKATSANSVLVPESLDEDEKEEVAKSLTFDEAVEYIEKSFSGISRESAVSLATFAFEHLAS